MVVKLGWAPDSIFQSIAFPSPCGVMVVKQLVQDMKRKAHQVSVPLRGNGRETVLLFHGIEDDEDVDGVRPLAG